MSRRNGDRARFQKERKRKMLRRQRVQELIQTGSVDAPAAAAASAPAARKGAPRKGGARSKAASPATAAAAKA